MRTNRVVPSRRGQRGFTLVELLVSLVAGLIVALSLMGISKEVNDTFFEESRTSQAETALRLAMQRLSGDLQRAAYMSTPNIRWDPLIMHVYGAAGGNVPSTGYPVGIKSLAGVRLNYAGSNVGVVGAMSAIQNPVLNPDSIDIAGNMTSPDRYPVLNVAEGTGVCTGQRIFLQPKTPAIWRIVGQAGGVAPNTFSTTTADQLMADVFQPVAGKSFILRIMDPSSGASQYVQTCATSVPAYNGGQPFVDVDPATPIWTAAFQTSQGLSSQGGQKVTFGGFKGFGEGAIVNPVAVVRWSIQPETALGLTYSNLNPNPLNTSVNDPNQFDLTRQFLDVTGTPVGTAEVVAEYAIDLKFGFTVDNEQPLNVSPPDPNGQGPFGLAPNLLTFDFDDNASGGGGNSTWAQDIGGLVTSPPGPQRIRSVRVRLAMRSSVPDRNQFLPVGGAGSPTKYVINPATGYLFSYCTDLAKKCVPPATNPVGGVKPVWARVRSVVTQVSLQNQARSFY